MPEQSLNLLPVKYRKVEIKFGHKTVLSIAGGSLFLVAAVLGLMVYLDVQIEKEVQLAQATHQEIALVLDDYKMNNSKKSLDETITIRIRKYEDLLRQRQRFLSQLDQDHFGNVQGFSGYLMALSRAKFPNIWIEDLAISGNGDAFFLSGKSVSPADITEYLNVLQEEPVMAGIVFDDLELTRVPHPKGDFVSFKVSYGDIAKFQSGERSSTAMTAAGLANF